MRRRSRQGRTSICSFPRTRSTRASAWLPASTRSPPTTAARKSPACWRVRRSQRRRGQRRSGCCARRRRSGGATMAAKATKALVDVEKLSKAQAKVEHMRLSLEIEAHNERYYQKDAPTVSDAAYDALRQRLV